MAEVFLAQQEGMAGVRRLAVVKKILPQFSEVETVAEMLLDEARIAIQLSHPNIVQIYELGQDDGQYFIAMEFVDGCDLATLARIERHRQGRVPMRLALRAASEAAMGLDFAHRQKDLEGRPLNIIHRDVSPHNIMCSREGAVKVTDFGIAKAVGKVQVTEVGVVKGKVQYMAPEQYTGAEIDQRADIFSLGVVLYQLTTGKLPRASKSGNLSMRRVIEGRIPLPSELRPDYPDVLEQIVMRSLAHNATDRYPDAASLRDDLLDFARQHDLLAFPKELGDYVNENVPNAPSPDKDDLAGKILYPRGKEGATRSGRNRDPDTVQFGTERVSQKRSVIAADQHSDPYGHTEMERALRAGGGDGSAVRSIKEPVVSEAAVLPDEQLTPFPEDKVRAALDHASSNVATRGAEVAFSSVSVDLSESPEAGDDDSTVREGDSPAVTRSSRRGTFPEDKETSPRGLAERLAPGESKARTGRGLRLPRDRGRRPFQAPRERSGQRTLIVLLALLAIGVVVGLAMTLIDPSPKRLATQNGHKRILPPPAHVDTGPARGISTPSAASGIIDVIAHPAACRVMIDGAQRCAKTPCRIEGLPLGTILVTLRHPGYRLWNQRVVLTASKASLVLRPTLEFGDGVKGAIVKRSAGKRSAGKRAAGKKSVGAKTVKGGKGKGKVIIDKADPTIALITIDVRPRWAEIWINGKKIGPTPLQRQIPPGRHTVELKNEKFGFHSTYKITAKLGTNVKILDSIKTKAPPKK